jgi:hypothetical protein
MIITDRGTTIVVTVTDHGPVEIAEERNEGQAFLDWWKERAQDYKAPRYRPRGADRRMALQMTARYGLDRLKRVGVSFWRRHSEPLISGEYGHHMILFQAKFAEAERDEQEIETTEIAE